MSKVERYVCNKCRMVLEKNEVIHNILDGDGNPTDNHVCFSCLLSFLSDNYCELCKWIEE